MRGFSFLVVTGLLLACRAYAAPPPRVDVECGLTERGVIAIDGLSDDWKGVPGTRRSSGSAEDASFLARCNYDREALYLSVDVTDDRLVRSKPSKKGDDHVVLVFRDARLEVFPAHADYRIPHVVNWTGPGGAKTVKVADALQPRGWFVEVAIPLGRVPGWGKGVPAVPFSVELHDADLLVEQRTQSVVSTGLGLLSFQEGSETFKWFLGEQKLRPQDIRLDVMANMDGEPGLERVVAGGRVVGILAEQYSYLQLPVEKPKDVLEVRVADLAGEGKSSVLARYVERGGGGSREVLAVFNLMPDGSVARTLAHEIGKQLGQAQLTNTWELVARPGKKKQSRGFDLVIRVAGAVGFTAENYLESPAEDMQPILLPWGETKEERWSFRGDEAVGGPVGTRR
ncbi:MAG: hypothetical protein HY698_00625 [Deltaproteobacteria bacterium]|nr:hypothetical protein [Deltaproteobacteria bacterium]